MNLSLKSKSVTIQRLQFQFFFEYLKKRLWMVIGIVCINSDFVIFEKKSNCLLSGDCV